MKLFSKIEVHRQRRRRGALLIASVVAALAASGAAFAHFGASSATAVSATFFANTVSNSQSQTCTAANNDSIQMLEGTYTGTATSTDTNLNGPITLQVRSVYDATTGAGSVTAFVRINGTGTAPSGFGGVLEAVNTGGHLQGMLSGREAGGGVVLGNLSAMFATTGFSSSTAPATVGSGTGTNTAIVSSSSCQPSQQGDQGKGGDFGGGKFGNFGNMGGQGHSGFQLNISSGHGHGGRGGNDDH
jgi:hypothetical protein